MAVYRQDDLKRNGDLARPVWNVAAPQSAMPILLLAYGDVPSGWREIVKAQPLDPQTSYVAVANQGSPLPDVVELQFFPSQLAPGVIVVEKAGRGHADPKAKVEVRPKSDYGCGS